MENEERHDQTDTGDPFSVFGEMAHIGTGLETGLNKYKSKLNEALLAATVISGHSTKRGRKEFSRIAKEAAQIYVENLELIRRAHEIRDQAHRKATTP